MGKGKWWLLGGMALGTTVGYAALRRYQRLGRRRATNCEARVLIVGAGVIGSSYACQMARWGLKVSLLARGPRLDELRTQGLQVQDLVTRQRCRQSVQVLAELPEEADYDLIILVVRHGQTAQALDVVAHLAETTPILVLQNNPSGATELAARLGQRGVLLGFPGTGGAQANGWVRSLPFWLGATVIGESDGADTQRLHQAAAILRWAHIGVQVESHIVSWLATHAAEIAVLAGVVLRNGGRVRRMARSSAEAKLYLAGLREAYAVLGASGIPITPATQAQLFERPVWVQLLIVRTLAWIPLAAQVIDHHVAAAPDEMRALYDHLLVLARQARVDVPVLESLAPGFASEA